MLVLLVQVWDALHISAVALPDARCQSSRRGSSARAEGDSRAVLPPTSAGCRACPVALIRAGLRSAVATQVHTGKAAFKPGCEFQSPGQGPGVVTWSGISAT